MTQQWALAQKAKLGNVYHLTCYGEVTPAAHCDHRVRLDPKTKCENPGTTERPGSVCGRCRNIEWHISKRR